MPEHDIRQFAVDAGLVYDVRGFPDRLQGLFANSLERGQLRLILRVKPQEFVNVLLQICVAFRKQVTTREDGVEFVAFLGPHPASSAGPVWLGEDEQHLPPQRSVDSEAIFAFLPAPLLNPMREEHAARGNETRDAPSADEFDDVGHGLSLASRQFLKHRYSSASGSCLA